MRRFRVTVEYDGTDFAGFQSQPVGLRTVQGTLEATIKRMSGAEARVHGAGRTDAGVHATGQVIHFDTEWPIPPGRIAWALNGALPDDVVVRDAECVGGGFHARFSATARTYQYTILNREAGSAIRGRFMWHVRESLDLAAMRAAAVELTGVHDFATFGQADLPGKSTVRHVEWIIIDGADDTVRITVRGNAFLRQQVRALVGTLQQAGLGKLGVADVVAIRDSRDRIHCPATAPARGLVLALVEYDGTRFTRPGEVGYYAAPEGTEKEIGKPNE